jgi:peptide/nickel transport system substrate-binding protein
VLRAGQFGDLVLTFGTPISHGVQNGYILYGVLEPMVRYRGKLEPDLVLLDQFDYNSDNTRLTARLKPDLAFHNGAPVTVDDVFFGVDLVANPDKYGAGASNLVAFAKRIVGMKALDKRTMEFSFDKPRTNMTDLFAQLQITPSAQYQALRSGKDVQGTGPYRFVSWMPETSIRLEANRSWHGTSRDGGPFLDAIDVKVFKDDDARGLAFEAGDLDLVLGAPASLAKRYKGTNQLHTAPKVGTYFLGTVVDNPALTDPRVRQAIFLAMDRKRMVEELQEGLNGNVTAQPWASNSPAFDPKLEDAFYDKNRAMALLREAGFAQPKPLILHIYDGADSLAQVVQQDLRDIGIDVEIRKLDTPTFNSYISDRKFTDLFISGHAQGNLLPLTTLQQTYHFQIPNPMHYQGQAYADAVAGLESLAPESPEAHVQYDRINRLFLEDPWLIPLQPATRIDLASSRVHGFGKYFVTMLQQVNLGTIGL